MSNNTYTWTITAMDAYPSAESQTNVVFNVHWTCSATDGATPAHTASIYNTCNVTYVAGTPFTPYAQLTQNEVLGWIWSSGVNQTATQEALDTMIANQINPPIVQLPLPWATA
jgi:hypothetical protein